MRRAIIKQSSRDDIHILKTEKLAVFIAGWLTLSVATWAQSAKGGDPATPHPQAKPAAAAKSSPGITAEQADAILDELRQIRHLLEKQQAANLRLPLSPPASAMRVTMRLEDEPHALGRADAPITVVEFGDYQCQYCRRFHAQTFPEFKKNYIDTGKVRFVSRDLPLDFHADAMPAAEAARCAGEQGKFWEMRDALLVSNALLNKENIDKLAQVMSLDSARFDDCLTQQKYKPAINKEASEAAGLRISGTPTFVVGKTTPGRLEGQRLVGALPYAQLDAILQALLNQSNTPR